MLGLVKLAVNSNHHKRVHTQACTTPCPLLRVRDSSRDVVLMNTRLLWLSPGLISFLQDLSVERAESEALELLPNNTRVSCLHGISSHLVAVASLPQLPVYFPLLTTKPW